MENQFVIVKYKTQKTHCTCCHQKLPKQKTSEAMEFKISKKGAMQYADWKSIAEDPDELEGLIPEYVYETIMFYTISLDERILIADSEIEKVKEFILREIVA